MLKFLQELHRISRLHEYFCILFQTFVLFSFFLLNLFIVCLLFLTPSASGN